MLHFTVSIPLIILGSPRFYALLQEDIESLLFSLRFRFLTSLQPVGCFHPENEAWDEADSDRLIRESDSVQAIEAFDTLAGSEELRLDYWLEAGDIQILNNHQIVHTRTHYEDWGVSGKGE